MLQSIFEVDLAAGGQLSDTLRVCLAVLEYRKRVFRVRHELVVTTHDEIWIVAKKHEYNIMVWPQPGESGPTFTTKTCNLTNGNAEL